MNYNLWIDVALFGAFLVGLHLFVKWDSRRGSKRGATPESSRAAIIRHQKIRRIEYDI